MILKHILFNVHLGNGHFGLSAALASKKKSIKDGECAVFINNKWTALKILVNDRMVIYYKHPNGYIAPETIRHIPNYLDGPNLNYKGALKQTIEKAMNKRK